MNTEDSKKDKSFYITTTLPYVNSDPHLGFAFEIVTADAIARYKKLQGYDVFFNTGTDEHGLKIFEKAVENNKTPQEYVDGYAERFKNLKSLLNLSFTNFIRTTDNSHVEAAQSFWKKCFDNGDIYKKEYQAKYCVGCELEKQDSELEDGKCPIHPNMEIKLIDEENYFFKFSKYQDELLKYYKDNENFITPDSRLNEIRTFIEGGLEDFSISRLKEKMPWGVAVPGDDDHVMYVWFDALVNYISTIGWPENEDAFNKIWKDGETVQIAGKDNLRQQSAMWQAMLMSAGLPLTKNIIIHGFITSDGKKMSKSLGNVIDPKGVVEKYGIDALRYFLIRELNPFEDSDFTITRFEEAYNANLANGIGNLTSRIMKMAEDHLDGCPELSKSAFSDSYNEAFEEFNIQKAADVIWSQIGDLDQKIQDTEPFKLVKEDKEKAIIIIRDLVQGLYNISRQLEPIMPETASKIQDAVKANKKPEESLFNRLA